MTDPHVASPPEAPVDIEFRVGRLSFDPHRIVYSTVILMAALSIYDEGTDPFTRGPLFELVGVTLAPLLALTLAHAFSDALDLQIRNRRRLTGSDRRHLLATNLEYMYVAIPPMLLLGVLALFGWDANDAVTLVEIVGAMSLGFWGAFAARKAGLGRWTQTRFAIGYGLMGLVVIAVELILTH